MLIRDLLEVRAPTTGDHQRRLPSPEGLHTSIVIGDTLDCEQIDMNEGPDAADLDEVVDRGRTYTRHVSFVCAGRELVLFRSGPVSGREGHAS